MGRPTLKTPEIIEAICARLETGEPLVWICGDDGMPGVRTVSDWAAADPDVSAAIAHARELGGDAIAAEALAIADQVDRDTIKGERGPMPDHEWIARSRLRVDTRLKLLAKWHPKRYGDKIDVTSGGEKIAAPELDEAVLAARAASIFDIAERRKNEGLTPTGDAV